MDRETRLGLTYAAFNARDIHEVLAQMVEDVDWPNAWEGGRIRGQEAVRDCWTREWAEVDPRVEPTSFAPDPMGAARSRLTRSCVASTERCSLKETSGTCTPFAAISSPAWR